MKNRKDYANHVRSCWSFSQDTAKEIINQSERELERDLALSIFDKCCSSYHYFQENDKVAETESLPPTDKQIKFAKDLGIQNLEQYTRQQLSERIDEAKRRKQNGQME